MGSLATVVSNAIIPDHLLNPTGVYKERLSQSALYYEATQVSDKEAKEVLKWYKKKGMTFVTGKKDKRDLTKDQLLWQAKTYIAAVRIADELGAEVVSPTPRGS